MRVRLVFFLVVFSTVLFGEQSLFNVPSSDITGDGKMSLQEQVSIVNSVFQLNSTVCFGLGYNAELGFNLMNVDINTQGEGVFIAGNEFESVGQLAPLFTVNAQKAVIFSEDFRMSFGSQAGMGVGGGKVSRIAAWVYLNTVTRFEELNNARLFVGAYYGNKYYLGREDAFSLMLGVEVPIVQQTFHFVADHIHGANSIGVTVAGFSFFIKKSFAFSVGYQLANSSMNGSGPVFELTFL